MNSLIHYAACHVWKTGSWNNCTCYQAVWRIRKEPGEVFAWRIWRYSIETMAYEHVMRCSTWRGAIELVEQFIWLRNNAVLRETHDA